MRWLGSDGLAWAANAKPEQLATHRAGQFFILGSRARPPRSVTLLLFEKLIRSEISSEQRRELALQAERIWLDFRFASVYFDASIVSPSSRR